MDPVVQVVLQIGAVGAAAGLLGGLFASSRTSLVGSIIMGILGSIAGAAVMRIAGVRPIYEAGEGFSYLYGAISGLLLGYVVSASNK
jgi:uncharacterized membrane protein YeaQ/YmgE (transglycosylase-associated protein family)